MAQRVMEISLALALVAMLWAHQASAQTGCTTAIVSLAPCLGYITGNSSTPSSSCCTQLASVVKSQVLCLCTLLNGGASSLGISINQTQALTLPGACKVQTPPISQCKAAAGPATSPAQSPEATPTPATPSTPSTPGSSTTTPSTASAPSVPSGSGSKTVPSTTGQSSAGSLNKSTRSTMFSVLFLVACVSSLAVL